MDHPSAHLLCANLIGNAATIRSEGAFYGSVGDGKVAFIDIRDIATFIRDADQPGYMGERSC